MGIDKTLVVLEQKVDILEKELQEARAELKKHKSVIGAKVKKPKTDTLDAIRDNQNSK